MEIINYHGQDLEQRNYIPYTLLILFPYQVKTYVTNLDAGCASEHFVFIFFMLL